MSYCFPNKSDFFRFDFLHVIKRGLHHHIASGVYYHIFFFLEIVAFDFKGISAMCHSHLRVGLFAVVFCRIHGFVFFEDCLSSRKQLVMVCSGSRGVTRPALRKPFLILGFMLGYNRGRDGSGRYRSDGNY